MSENPPRTLPNEPGEQMVEANNPESSGENSGDSQETGPQPGTSVAETILADEREAIAQGRRAETLENLRRHADASPRAEETNPGSTTHTTRAPAAVHKQGGRIGASVLGTGKNIFALFGLFGSWILMALKGAGAMAGKGGGGGGGHAKKDDHGGGHH